MGVLLKRMRAKGYIIWPWNCVVSISLSHCSVVNEFVIWPFPCRDDLFSIATNVRHHIPIPIHHVAGQSMLTTTYDRNLPKSSLCHHVSIYPSSHRGEAGIIYSILLSIQFNPKIISNNSNAYSNQHNIFSYLLNI